MFNTRFSKQPANQARFYVSTLNQPANSNEDLSQEQLSRGQDCQEAGSQSVSEPSQMNPAVEKIKELATSRLFLAAAIGYTVVVVLSLIYSVTVSIDPNQSQDFVISAFTEAIIINFPSVLIAVGLWKFYRSSHDLDDRSTTGLLFIETAVIIAQFPILFFLSIFVMMGADNTNDAAFAFSIICTLLYGLGVRRTVRAVRRTIETGIASDDVSKSMGVMNFIFAGVMVFAILISLMLMSADALGSGDVYVQGFITRIPFVYTTNPIMILISSISVGILILFGILIFFYRIEMKRLFGQFVQSLHMPK